MRGARAVTPGEARQTLGLTVAQMVRLCDVPRSTWNCWERGERKPDRAATALIALWIRLHEEESEAYQRLAKI